MTEFRIFSGPQGLQALWPQWAQLAAELPAARYLHAPGWYQSYLGALASAPERVHFIAACRRSRLIGVLPLESRVRRLGLLGLRILGTPQSDHLNLSDFLFEREVANAPLLRELTDWLRRQRDLQWDVLHLNKIAEDSCIDYALRNAAPATAVSRAFTHSYYFDTSGSYEAATRSLAGSFRRNLRRLNRRAAETAALHWESVDAAERLPASFEVFLQLEASGWKGEQGEASAIRCNPALLRYYQALLAGSDPQARYRINILRLGELPIAAQLAVQSDRTLQLLKIAISDAHAALAPGHLALEHTLRQACAEQQIDTVSLITGPEWARIWRPLSHAVSSHMTVNATLRGALWLQLQQLMHACRALSGPRAAPQAGGTPAAPEAAASTDGAIM